MIRIQSNFNVRRVLLLAYLFIISIGFDLHAQRGLQYTPEEIRIWRQRTGLSPGGTMYKSFGDVSQNSPGDWDRILVDALTAAKNPANDRFTNYDVTQGLNKPITELSSPWARNRTTQVDDKEPRPSIRGRDYGAISLMNAGFVYLLIGGDGGNISGVNGVQFAAAVKNELLWYAQNPWLDFSNRKRWSLDSPFYDRNPGFFIACWLNTILNAYDYTKHSSVYSARDKEIIDKWMINASVFFHDLSVLIVKLRFLDYDNGTYTNVPRGWQDHNLGAAWQGSSYVAYGLNEGYANRASAMWRFIMRSGLFYKDHPKNRTTARKHIKSSHRWFKEWMAYGTFADGTYADFHRGEPGRPQTGLYYSSIGIGSMVELADTYERTFANEPTFESLYNWELTPGSKDYNTLFPKATEGRLWRRSFELKSPKGLKTVVTTFMKYIDGSFGNSRRWGSNNIDGHSVKSVARVIVDTDIWLAQANVYYKDNYIKSVYTRTKPGIRQYDRNPTRAGSYDIHLGVWGSSPGPLLLSGNMEGLVWPYNNVQALAVESRELSVPANFDFAGVEINNTVSKSIVIGNTGNSELEITSITSDNENFKVDFSGKIAPFSSSNIEVSFTPTAIKKFEGNLTVNSNKTVGNNVIRITGLGTEPPVPDTEKNIVDNFTKIEAEDAGYEIVRDVKDISEIKPSTANTSNVSNQSALALFDKGDKVKYIFNIVKEAQYAIHVRVRSGNNENPTRYWPDGYSFELNGNKLVLIGNENTISSKDASYGGSFWGTMSNKGIDLVPGTYNLSIEATESWQLIDYIEIKEVNEEPLVEERILSVNEQMTFDQTLVGSELSQEVSFKNQGNLPLSIKEIRSDNKDFRIAYAGTIEPGDSANALLVFIPSHVGDCVGKLTIVSDKTEGPEKIKVTGEGVALESIEEFATKLEAEDYFEVSNETGNKGTVETSKEISSLLSNEKAVKLFDEGDALKFKFAVSEKGEYKLNVRLRTGDRTSSTSFVKEGYIFKINGVTTSFELDPNSISIKDEGFGISYWGVLSAKNQSLERGTHELEVIALRNWGAVDYLEIIGKELAKPELTVTNNIDFSEVHLGEEATEKLILFNTGNTTLNITGFEISENFSGSFSGEILPGDSTEISIGFSPKSETNYAGQLKINLEGLESKLVSLSGTGIASKNFKIEAEEHFVKVSDVGNKGRVAMSLEESFLLSENKGVNLFDKGDAITIPFEVNSDGTYTIKVRLRTGNRVSEDSYVKDGYSFKLNNVETFFQLEDGSLSKEDPSFGITYWGTMQTTGRSLNKGTHTLTIEAQESWAVVDYIELVKESDIINKLIVTQGLDFSEVELDSELVKEISIKNDGNAKVTLVNSVISDVFFGEINGEILPGEEKTFPITFRPNAIEDYTSELLITAVGISPETVSLQGTGIAPKPVSLFIEAENDFEVSANVGNKGDIEATQSDISILSNGQGLKLFDSGDKVNFKFSVPKKSNYEIIVRLRAGDRANISSYLPNGYKISLDKEELNFSIVDNSISELQEDFGLSSWGSLSSGALVLDEKEYILEIEALLPWALVDYIEVKEIVNISKRYIDLATNEELDQEVKEEKPVSVNMYPNPASNYIKIDFENVEKSVDIIIVDMFGQVMYNQFYDADGIGVAVDLTSFSRGFYLVNVNIGGDKISRRILVE